LVTGDWLRELRDIHVPLVEPAVEASASPVAMATVGILALALVLVAAVLCRPMLARRVRRHRTLARVRSLRRAVANGLPASEACAALSALLRTTALARGSRPEVAAIHGEDWLAFLDRNGGDGAFRGPAAMIATAPFERDPRVDTEAVFAACERWLARNA